jgi:RNA polymerase-binding transcription factor DksA
MTPTSKGSQAKRVPASRSTTTSRSGNKSKAARVGATATKRPALTKKKAAPVVKKAATTTKKATSTAKKAAPAATRKASAPAKKATAASTKTAPTPKKAAPATKKAAPAKKTAPAAKKAAPEKAAAKKAPSAPARAANGAGAAPTPARTPFTPKPKPPAPVRPKTGPYAKDAKFLEEVRELLEADRVIYQEQATSLRAEADSLALEREPGDVQFDEESGEGGTVTVDRERNLALSGQATLAVEEIDDALARIKDKTFGYCERCFQPIPKPRLRALPYARLCVACKSGGLSRR